MVAAACPKSNFSQLEMGEECIPFLGSEIAVLLAGPLGPAAGDERPMMRDHIFGEESGDEFYITGGVAVGAARQAILACGVGDVGDKFTPINIDDRQMRPIPSITGDIVVDFDDNAADIIVGARAFDQDAADDKDADIWLDLARQIAEKAPLGAGGAGLLQAAVAVVNAARKADKADPLGAPLLFNQGDLSVAQLDPRSPIWLGRTWSLEPPRGTSWWNSYSYNVDYRVWREDHDFTVSNVSSTFPQQELNPGGTASALITMRNTGHATFMRDGDYATTLRTANPDAAAWLDTVDPRVVDGNAVHLDRPAVQRGQLLSFTVPLRAPKAGLYHPSWVVCVDGLPLGRYPVPASGAFAELVCGKPLTATVETVSVTYDRNGQPTATFIVRGLDPDGKEVPGHVTPANKFSGPPVVRNTDPVLGQRFQVQGWPRISHAPIPHSPRDDGGDISDDVPHRRLEPWVNDDISYRWPDGWVSDGDTYRGTWTRLDPGI